MKSFKKSIDSVYALGFSNETIDFFIEKREFILDAWIKNDAITDIYERLELNEDKFRQNIAIPLYNYFQIILYQKNLSGYCPEMHLFVEYFYHVGLRIEEVFINYTSFKNTLLQLYNAQQKDSLNDEKRKLLIILDYNLFELLSVYYDIIHSFNKDNESNCYKDNKVVEIVL